MSAQKLLLYLVPSKANQANDVFPSTLSGMRVALKIRCYSKVLVVGTVCKFASLSFVQSSAEDASSRRERRAYLRQVPRPANAVVVELPPNRPCVDQRSL